jgi:hypothetical protein
MQIVASIGTMLNVFNISNFFKCLYHFFVGLPMAIDQRDVA